ncbi:MAG: ABC transporter substrate-binding protein, partial [Alphaproteobacteria bacterium]|nr:ABC transporter substrate-binding protein [Alphaproteobacteria bacterium]
MTARSVAWMLALAALMCSAPMAPRAQEHALTVTSWGGAYMDSQRETYFKPFTARTGIRVREAEYEGEFAKIKAMVDSKKVAWDVVDLGSAQAMRGCDDGIFEKLDYARIGERGRFMPGAALDCAVGTI